MDGKEKWKHMQDRKKASTNSPLGKMPSTAWEAVSGEIVANSFLFYGFWMARRIATFATAFQLLRRKSPIFRF